MTHQQNLTVPPQAIEAEQSVLGSLMLESRHIDDVSDVLEVRDFYRADHQVIYTEILKMHGEGVAVDVVSVSESLTKTDKIDQVGGLSYLGSLAKNTPNAGHVKSYAQIIRDNATLRRIIEVGNDMVKSAYHTGGKKPAEIVDAVECAVMEIAGKANKSDNDPVFINQPMSAFLDELEMRSNNKGEIFGLATGFTDLDFKTSGFGEGDLVIVAGRPSMGKTSLMMNIVENCAIKDSKRIQVFSLEMPAKQLAMRMAASVGRVSMQKFKTGNMTTEDWPKLTNAVGLIHDKSIQIDDTSAMTVSGVRSSSRRMASKTGGVDLIVIDYLQLMTDNSGENRTQQISNISRGLKALAKEQGCPVIVLSQLNRGLEQRPNKRPVMSDLRESGAIEQDADVILFVYRHEVYEPETDQQGIAEIIIGKQRNGPLGTVKLAWRGEFTRFENYADPRFR